VRPRLTVQDIQERFPWLMWPTRWVDQLLTPRRWFPRSPVAAAVERFLTQDSAPLARSINARMAWASRLRARLLSDQPGLVRPAWAVRRLVWSTVWAFIAVMRLWPRPLRRPTANDVPVSLLPAPDTYPDFTSPTLVVPSDSPLAEMTLPGAITVQALHVLQDVYPIISTHQPLAATDADERQRQAYPWLYHAVRTPPRWHRDLRAAAAQGNVLGALAVGGPFAKLLERRDGPAGRYLIDLNYLRNYPVRDGLARIGCRIFFDATQGALVPSGIEYDGRLIGPGERDWSTAERLAQCSLLTHTTVWRHGMQFHVGGVAPFAVLTHQLPAHHPLRRLMAPHVADTLSTNVHTHLTLRRGGFDVTGFSFSYDTILRYYDDGARYFDISRLDPRVDIAQRGLDDAVDYPHQAQALMYLGLFEDYVRRYLDVYYADDTALALDAAANAWFDGLDRALVRGIRHYVASCTKANLVRLCALFIYSVSVEHEDNTMWDYAVFLPATVRADGVGQSRGEVQSVQDFQLIISSATNRLMNDASHVALDARGAAVMADFQRTLTDLQRSLESQPDHYWRIYPKNLEASISA
jgi:hypothetical protein